MTVLRRADGREITLHADRTTLGRAPSCDVVLDDPDVAPRHASILRTDRGWLLVDESAGLGMTVDGVPVANHFLREGESVRLGNSTLAFSDRGGTLLGTPRPPLRPALELEGLRGVATGARPSSTPTAPGTRTFAPPSSTPTVRGPSRAEPEPEPEPKPEPEPEPPAVSGRTIPAPIAAPPPFGGAATREELPRATTSIYEAPAAPPDPDDRPFVRGDASPRAQSVYSLGDDGPRASLDPVVDVYTLGRPGPGPSSASVYSLGEAETILAPVGGHASAPAPPPPSSAAFAPPPPPPPPPPPAPPPPPPAPSPPRAVSAPLAAPRPSSASAYSLGSPERRPGESWSWVRPEPERDTRASTRPRRGRGVMMFGLVLVVLGLVLVAVAFALGVTIADIERALAGR